MVERANCKACGGEVSTIADEGDAYRCNRCGADGTPRCATCGKKVALGRVFCTRECQRAHNAVMARGRDRTPEEPAQVSVKHDPAAAQRWSREARRRRQDRAQIEGKS